MFKILTSHVTVAIKSRKNKYVDLGSNPDKRRKKDLKKRIKNRP
jgi:hypothetical protein